MQGKRTMGLKAFFTVTLLVTSSWASEKVLHNFGSSHTDGQSPVAGVVFDSAGNMYGTTMAGGSKNMGTVFETSPTGSGGWTTALLYSFGQSGSDGQNPEAGLIFDASGNLYGTTYAGGSAGGGTVFELSPNGSGGWTEKVLHNFGISQSDGQNAQACLVFDSAGNLYGTTVNGGTQSEGTVFELLPNGSGGYTEKVLHNFFLTTNDGENPEAGLVFDSAGNLYGTTFSGGSAGHGTVFELVSNGTGGFTEKVLHNFFVNGDDDDGSNPQAGVIFDTAGNIYGTTKGGGSEFFGAGAVYELTPSGLGTYSERVLHTFAISGSDGKNPLGSLILDSSGNLWGTADKGGTADGGIVFKMTPNGSGGWTESIVHSFQVEGDSSDGANPQAGLVADSAGNLYGTTNKGGTQSDGAVFEVTP
jgi:uncharacterized repeat protein (TIGR03803 family)